MIRSIPTRYAGTQFRSRLEAGWAAFFDNHGIKWAYEAEGFDLDGIRYLPDFYLPDQRVFVEVKGLLDTKDRTKLSRLALAAADVDAIVVLAEAPVGREFSLIKAAPEFTVSPDVELVRCEACDRWTFTDTVDRTAEITLPDDEGNLVTDVIDVSSRDCRYQFHGGEQRRWYAMGGTAHPGDCDVCDWRT